MIDNTEILGLGCDVWEAAAGSVVEASILVADLLEVRRDGDFLVQWSRPEVGESAGREEHGSLRLDVPRPADGSHIWARGGELRLELGGVLAVVGEAVIANSGIARREQDGLSTCTELGEEVADLVGV